MDGFRAFLSMMWLPDGLLMSAGFRSFNSMMWLPDGSAAAGGGGAAAMMMTARRWRDHEYT